MSSEPAIVDREEVRVMFKRAADEQEAITRTWSDVESAVGSLKGRKFFGVFDPRDARIPRVRAVAGR